MKKGCLAEAEPMRQMPKPLRFPFASPMDEKVRSVSDSVSWEDITGIRRIHSEKGERTTLTQEEERFLFRVHKRVAERVALIKAELCLEGAGSTIRPSLQKEAENLELIGCTIAHIIARANQGLVKQIALEKRRNIGNGWFKNVDIKDLIQEGNIGMMEAVGRFDAERGTKFSTYATYWIGTMIDCCLYDKELIISLSHRKRVELGKIFAFCNYYYTRNYREPDIDEISKATGFEPEKIIELIRVGERSEPKPDSEEDKEDDRFARISDRDTLDSVNALIISELRGILDRAMHKLPPLEREILKRRVGFEDDKDETLEEVGNRHGLDKYATRYLEGKAIDRMRKMLKEIGLEEEKDI